MRSTDAALIAPALFWSHRVAAQQCVNSARNILVHQNVVAINDLYDHVEGWWRLALQHALLRAASARLVVTESDALNTSDEVSQSWVQHQVVEAIAVGGSDQLHATLGDRSRSDRLSLGTDFVDHDHLGHMVFDRLDHDQVLSLWSTHLHAACLANRGVRDVSIASDLV